MKKRRSGTHRSQRYCNHKTQNLLLAQVLTEVPEVVDVAVEVADVAEVVAVVVVEEAEAEVVEVRLHPESFRQPCLPWISRHLIRGKGETPSTRTPYVRTSCVSQHH
jgi:hypothetical protein